MPQKQGCDDGHDHPDTLEMGVQYSLYSKIDTENLECLNEASLGSGKDVFKPWEDRLNFEKFVESDTDEELLFNIPFTGNVKLKGVLIIGGEQESHPAKMKLYKNRPKMTFIDTTAVAEQEFELNIDSLGTLEYSTMAVKFSSVHHLTIYIPSNFGAERTKIYYIGLKGEFKQAHKHGVTICTYEARPNVSNFKDENIDHVNYEIQ